MVILVTGASGQLGQALQSIAVLFDNMRFHFADSIEADITNKESLNQIFNLIKPDYCINAAAYTAVDKSESEPEKAQSINAEGARNMAEVCNAYDAVLIHVSTDFVFDGAKLRPYKEEDPTNPQGVYGKSKRDGEIEIEAFSKKYFIVRTSWLYSGYGNNFMKTMLRLSTDRDSLSVVNDQIGTPTHAVDLAEAILQIIDFHWKKRKGTTSYYGIYHFSNEGTASWYDFAAEIFRINNIQINLNPISTAQYPTPAVRPAYSVLDKSKIKQTFGILIKDWKQALNDRK